MLSYPRTTTGWGIGTTDTFRNKSRKLLNKYGGNLQNQSDKISSIYIPDKGKIFISADLAGAEALIVAYLTPNGNFRKLFANNIKPHTYVAAHIFHTIWRDTFGDDCITSLLSTDINNLSSHPKWKEVSSFIKNSAEGKHYFIGKKSCHSFNYRKMPNTFIFDVLKESEGKVVLDLKEGQRIHSIYHGLFPEIEQIWHREQDEILRRTRCLRNLFGYPRMFYGNFTDKFFREATAFIPQSTVGCITNIAYAELQNFIEDSNKRGWDLLNNKHDSILLQCNEEEKEEAIHRIKAALEVDLVSPRNEHFKMKSEVSVGRNWSKYSNSNPEGMKEI